MKLSLVIPVYNEADLIGLCLDSVAAQNDKPDEVIVVDNNSDDQTAAIAASYGFVRLVHEPRQGVVHARTTGFNLASGDVIARIDGDSILPEDWVHTVKAVMSNGKVDAVSGQALYYGVAAARLFNRIDLFFRRRLARQLNDQLYLWGANMAVRNEAWRRVRSALCMRGGQHEDYDIAIHLQEKGGRVIFDERLKAAVSSRRIDSDFMAFMRYAWICPSTYNQHGRKVLRYMYPVLLACAVGYLPALLLYRGYDPTTGRFSLAQLFASVRLRRVDPTTNVA